MAGAIASRDASEGLWACALAHGHKAPRLKASVICLRVFKSKGNNFGADIGGSLCLK
jgi:hypothetical protein